MPAPPGTVLDAAEIREEIRHGPCSQGVYRFGDTDVKGIVIYNTSAMKQTLNEGTGGQWEEEIGFSWGTPVGQQGGVFAGVLKAMQISTGEDRNAGHFRWAASPKARVRGLDFYPSVSFPSALTSGELESVWFTRMGHPLPGWACRLEISTSGGSFSVALWEAPLTKLLQRYIPSSPTIHFFAIHLCNMLEPLLCASFGGTGMS